MAIMKGRHAVLTAAAAVLAMGAIILVSFAASGAEGRELQDVMGEQQKWDKSPPAPDNIGYAWPLAHHGDDGHELPNSPHDHGNLYPKPPHLEPPHDDYDVHYNQEPPQQENHHKLPPCHDEGPQPCFPPPNY